LNPLADGDSPGPGSTSPARLLRLVQLCDSALPVGAYSHSWGLEAAIDRREVAGPADLERWARAWLAHAVAPGDGLACAHAARAAAAGDWDGLANLNDLVTAARPAPTLRRASLNQGAALLGLASGWPWSGRVAAHVLANRPTGRHHAVAFGSLADAAGASAEEALALYLQNAAAGIVAAAVRAVPVGHTHGQQVLARLHTAIIGLAARWADSPLDGFGGLSPAYEVLTHAQTQLYTRLFQS
jgi:urease accessory protein